MENPIIEMHEVLNDHFKTKTKRGDLKLFKWVVNYFGFIKICPSEKSAFTFLEKNGYRYDFHGTENLHFKKTHKSEDEMFLERHFRKIN